MKTLKYISKAIDFLKSLNMNTKENTADKDDFEFTYAKFGLNLKHDSDSGKVPNSLFHQMYAEENETLFI